jgi:hypothetical protein
MPKASLQAPVTLYGDEFVGAVRGSLPRRRELTAADIAWLRAEYAQTMQPAREAQTRIASVDRRLSDLVNQAYGLTREDVELVWRDGAATDALPRERERRTRSVASWADAR